MVKPKIKDEDVLHSIQSHQGPMDPFTFKRYLKDIEDIAKRDAFSAFNLKGVLYSIYQPNDSTEALNNFKKALGIVDSANRPRLLANYSKALFHYNKVDEFISMALQTIDASAKSYGSDSEFTQDVLFTTLARFLGLSRFVEAKQMLEKYMQTISSDWYQQDALVRFVREQDNQALLEEMQKQELICQTTLAGTGINVQRADYTVMPYGDCVVTLTLNANSNTILELTERKLQLMMEQEFLPERFNLLFN